MLTTPADGLRRLADWCERHQITADDLLSCSVLDWWASPRGDVHLRPIAALRLVGNTPPDRWNGRLCEWLVDGVTVSALLHKLEVAR